MSRGVNKVILIGRLTRDPECKFLPSGGAVTNFSLATSEAWKDKNTGQKQERSEFHNIVIFNKLAEIAGEYLRKGSMTYIEGSLRTRKWTDKDGNDRYTTEIVADQMQMLDNKSGGQSDNQGGGGIHQGQPSIQNGAGGQPSMDSFDDLDSIPF